jgi:RHS repeat-associated protein
MFVCELLNGTVKATYLVGPRGPEYRRDDQAGTIRWYVYDGLGSVVGEVAPDGTLTRAQSFDVYGCVRTGSGAATTKHRFVGALGHPSDDETGLIYMRARHMDPVCGRFVSEDPANGGHNWLAYCSDNPVNKVDANGKNPYSIGIASEELLMAIYEGIREGLTFGEILTDVFGGDVYFALGEAGGVSDAIALIRFTLSRGAWMGIEVDEHGMLGQWIADEIGCQRLGQLCTGADLYDIETGEATAIETGSLGAL